MDTVTIITFALLSVLFLIMFFSLYTIYPRKNDYGVNRIGGVRGVTTLLSDVEAVSAEKFNNFPINKYKMGPLSNLDLNKFNPTNINNITTTPLYTAFGTQQPLDNIMLKPVYNHHVSVDGDEKSPTSMSIFRYNKCSPSCCPNTYSCNGGCVCQTKKQRNFINSRGFNRS
tara:strand:+ start:4591 stop:5103 length:513 start_codon:yes stop_codon:yes gene_type:complete